MIRWCGLLVLSCVFPAVAPAQDSAQAPVPSRSVGLSLAEALQTDLDTFASGVPFGDDRTFVMLRRSP